jgi:hypothetical protein
MWFDNPPPPLGLAFLTCFLALGLRLMYGAEVVGLGAPVSAVWRAGRGQFVRSLAAIVAGMAAFQLGRWLVT